MSLAEKLVHMKKQLHLTTEEIANQSGVPLGTLNKIFAGQTKNPSPLTLLQIAKTLRTPLCYLLDSSVPLTYTTAAWADTCGLVSLSPEEMHLLEEYRNLSPKLRHTFTTAANELGRVPSPDRTHRPTLRLVCYTPVPLSQQKMAGDHFKHSNILVASDPVSQGADFALQLISDAVEPIFSMGSVLLCKRGAVAHNRLGLFQLNQELYICKLYAKRGKTKLVPVNVDLKSITVAPGDDFKMLGAILGAANCYRWGS